MFSVGYWAKPLCMAAQAWYSLHWCKARATPWLSAEFHCSYSHQFRKCFSMDPSMFYQLMLRKTYPMLNNKQCLQSSLLKPVSWPCFPKHKGQVLQHSHQTGQCWCNLVQLCSLLWAHLHAMPPSHIPSPRAHKFSVHELCTHLC